MIRTPEQLVEYTVWMTGALRENSPLVQCITNEVVSNFTANVLLSVGASPAMAAVPGEAGPFASIASAVLINLGTPASEQREAMREAAQVAHTAASPWVLDPVAVGALPIRTAAAAELCDLRPSVVRGNASEILVAAGEGTGGRGVDSTDGVDAALPAARSLAARIGGVVALSGPVDAITDGERVVRIANGHPYLTQITGGGCALGAVIAACISVDSDDHLAATVAASTLYTVAAEVAAERAFGPGSFGVAFVDALAGLNAQQIRERAKLS